MRGVDGVGGVWGLWLRWLVELLGCWLVGLLAVAAREGLSLRLLLGRKLVAMGLLVESLEYGW